MTNIVNTKLGGVKVEIVLTKEQSLQLLQFAFSELLSKGALHIVKEREEWLMKITPEGNA